MRYIVIVLSIVMLVIVLPAAGFASAPSSRCEEKDRVCREFEQLAEAEQPGKIVEKYEEAGAEAVYSEGARFYAGQAYLALAAGDNINPAQEESCYWKALKLGNTAAYMGLYFFHVQKDEEKALGFLREYVKTGPADTVPFVILGESELDRNHYASADRYLREAKKVARAYSPRVDWLLFQANYLLKNYRFASEMLTNALAKGTFEKEIKSLSSDPRFSGIEKIPEFEGLRKKLKVAKSSN